MRIIVYGAGKFGKYAVQYLSKRNDTEVVAVVDREKADLNFCGYMIMRPERISDYIYDYILITPMKENMINEMQADLIKQGISSDKIKRLIDDKNLVFEMIQGSNLYDESDPRVNWLKEFANYVYINGIEGSVAECGVDKGDFAFYINYYFNDRKLYLFDTFEGFVEADIKKERELNQNSFNNGSFNHAGGFIQTSEELVYGKMPYNGKVVMKKGYFPETAKDCDDYFAFVNLDMDLYQPTLAALSFFYSKMNPGGVILCHDYFHPELPGIKKAIEDFSVTSKEPLRMLPIGDNCSIAIVI